MVTHQSFPSWCIHFTFVRHALYTVQRLLTTLAIVHTQRIACVRHLISSRISDTALGYIFIHFKFCLRYGVYHDWLRTLYHCKQDSVKSTSVAKTKRENNVPYFPFLPNLLPTTNFSRSNPVMILARDKTSTSTTNGRHEQTFCPAAYILAFTLACSDLDLLTVKETLYFLGPFLYHNLRYVLGKVFYRVITIL